MALTFGEMIASAAKSQLDINKKAVGDSVWVDKVIAKITETDPFSQSGSESIRLLQENKEQIYGLGSEAFLLFIHQLANGNDNDAAETYVRAKGSADDLIYAMTKGALGVIEAKKKLDQMHEEALALVLKIAVVGARCLLPVLLALI